MRFIYINFIVNVEQNYSGDLPFAFYINSNGN